MTTLRLVMGDQLSRDIAALADLDRDRDVVLMVEVEAEARHVPHHKQKIVLVLSAMRHFAGELAAEGIRVDYVRLEDAGNTGHFDGEVARAVARHGARRLVVTAPSERRVAAMVAGWGRHPGLAVEVRADDRFLASSADFADFAAGRRQLRMEWFYRLLRRRNRLLMDGDTPAGGRWNFDADNRAPWPAGETPPRRRRFAPDAITREVMALVERRFGDHFGDLAAFGWPVTRADALVALGDFIAGSLPRFGATQDAMRRGAPFLHHALLAPALNLGLLGPREVCEAAEAEWRAGRAPLAAVEGFIRQILGWREYVRGLYWWGGEAWAATNALAANRPLPAFFWTGETDMACVAEVIGQTRREAYAHHIQRLMIIGNFALLAGLAPREVEAWFHIVYADAFEWVELPNVHAMALYADGGVLASKPYAAARAYISRMSDYCTGCRLAPRGKAESACPFDILYWDFLSRHAGRLQDNPRLAMPYRALARLTPARRDQIHARATAWLETMERGTAAKERGGETQATFAF